VEHVVTEEVITQVSTRFELAVRPMIERWMAAGRITISAADVQLAREFLEQCGWKVEELPGGVLRIVKGRGRSEEMSREAAVVAALRRLAERA
jgi:hypothetical protein